MTWLVLFDRFIDSVVSSLEITKSKLFFSIWTENKQEEDLHIIVAKIPKIYIPSVFMSESESKDMKKHIRGAEIEKKRRGAEIEPIQKPKTIPVLRPRAVVSSPGM